MSATTPPDSTPRAATARSRGARLTAVAITALLGSAFFAATPCWASLELPVSELRVVSQGQADVTAITELLGLEVGAILDRRQLREAILAIYARAEIEWLRVEAEEVDGGLVVTVRVNFRSEISRIEVKAGGNPILKKRVEKWLELQPGARVTVGIVEAARRRVARRLGERGYTNPLVDLYLEYHRRSNTVRLTVEVSAGEPQVIHDVLLIGDLDPETAQEALPKVKEGARLTSRLEERLRRQAESAVRGLGYWEAQVVQVNRLYRGAGAILEIHVDAGPRYELELVTVPEFERKLRNAIPDPAEEDLHPAQTAALAERIRERLQKEGHLLAQVTAELDTSGAVPLLRVEVEPGSRRKVSELRFQNAESLSDEVLAVAVNVRPGSVTGFWGRTTTDSSLEEDRLAIEETYRSYGFVEASVGEVIMVPEGEDQVAIVFPIVEGRRWYLVDLRIEGLPVEAAGRLEDHPIDLVEASPWNPRQVESSRRQLETLLADTGYPEGRVEAEVDTSVPEEARVVLRAYPGSYVRIGKVVIAGLTRTRESVVSRIIRRAGIKTGQPFARDRMMDAQRRLHELGLFRRVELVPMPGQERRTERGLVVALEEGRQRSYLVGVGWNETDRFRLTLGWSHLNLFGGAHAFTAETRFSNREQRYQIGLREPRVPKLDVPAYMVIYRTFEEFRERGYDQRRRGLWIDVGDRLERPFRKWLRYEYQIVLPELTTERPPELEREEQEARIASLTPTLEWDFRNSPLVPTSGTFSSVSLEYAFPAFAADSEFLKLQTRFTLYRQIGKGVGAVGARFGAIESLGQDTGDPKNLQVPISTRFFAGGSSTHRAFKTDFLGVPDQTLDENGNPIGGNALLLINLEYQYPVSGFFSVVFFLDVGNVWESPSQIKLGQLRYGFGPGIRVDTPAGPLRAEYGFKLDRTPDESAGHFFLSFGIPF
jgi:outer membrane protein assembly complex protein YaeT